MDTLTSRYHYPSDISDEEWALVAPYLTLMKPDARQRDHDLRQVLNGLRWIVRTGSAWRYMPHDLPPWHTVYQQAQRGFKAGCFEAIVADLRVLIRLGEGRNAAPTAAIIERPEGSRHYGARRRTATVAGTMVTSGRRARSCIWRWIRWVSTWRSW